MGKKYGSEHRFYSHFKLWELIGIVVLVLVFVFGVGMDVSDQPLYERWKAWALALWTLSLLTLLVPAGIRCANKGVRSVWSVVSLFLAVLALVLVTFYTCFFWATQTTATSSPSTDKILNFPPMLAALWAAGVGWYITFQASAKNHRTTNSFNLIMQTRTSREFLDRAQQVQLTYPHGHPAPKEDEDLFGTNSLKTLTAHVAAQEAAGEEVEAELKDRLFRARGADALKYLLNYYEFMAVGIDANDLDEELLYDTIGVTVTSIYHRSKVFLDYVRDPQKGNQPLAFNQLDKLVASWDKRLKDEIKETT